jgi:hypothetical protein
MKKLFWLVCLMVLASSIQSLAIESGWWWNPNESGRGIALEIQGSKLFLAWYTYDQTTGEPLWISSGGPMTDATHYTGPMWRYKNGQCIGCPYTPPDAPETIGTLSLTFQDSTHATLTCMGGTVTVKLERFRFGDGGQDNKRAKTEMLKGHWWFTFTIITTFHHDYDLWDIRQGTDPDLPWVILGEDEWGDPVIGGYDFKLNAWAILDPGTIIHRFYVFQTDGTTVTSGCYYQVDPVTGSFSNCYALSGYKTESSHTTTAFPDHPDQEEDEFNEVIEAGDKRPAAQSENLMEIYQRLKALAGD